jgi:hypothetical protein
LGERCVFVYKSPTPLSPNTASGTTHKSEWTVSIAHLLVAVARIEYIDAWPSAFANKVFARGRAFGSTFESASDLDNAKQTTFLSRLLLFCGAL